MPKFIKNSEFLEHFNNLKEIGSREVSKLVTDGDHGYPKYVEGGVYYVKSKELSCLDIDFSMAEKVSYSYANKLGDRCKLNQDDVIISTVGKIGSVFIINYDIQQSISCCCFKCFFISFIRSSKLCGITVNSRNTFF